MIYEYAHLTEDDNIACCDCGKVADVLIRARHCGRLFALCLEKFAEIKGKSVHRYLEVERMEGK